jgi:hypothetical protein
MLFHFAVGLGRLDQRTWRLAFGEQPSNRLQPTAEGAIMSRRG